MTATERELGFDAKSVLLCGWTMVDDPKVVVDELLVWHREVPVGNREDGKWFAQPVFPGNPVGPPSSLLAIRGPVAEPIETVPGSQGLSGPPPGHEHVIRRHSPADGRWLVLDARCWNRYRTSAVAEVHSWQVDLDLRAAQ